MKDTYVHTVMNPPRTCANAYSPLQRHRPPTTTRMQHYLAHRGCDHAIAISPSPSQSRSCNQPFATSGVTTPVATAHSPIARSLVLSIYSDPRSIPTPLWVLALTQLINGHGISPDSSLLTTCLPSSLVFSVLASEHPSRTTNTPVAPRTPRSQPPVTTIANARLPKHPLSFLLVFANQPGLV
jgi:hypothetical protein